MMKKIILCADDYGQNQSISQAIITLFEKNRLSATSCMTTSPDWLTCANQLKPFIDRVDLGLHFNLTEGMPLSVELRQAHGFMPLSKLLVKAYLGGLNRAAIEAEWHAQLDAFVVAVGRLPDFIDGHQHVHQLPTVRDAFFHVYKQRLFAAKPYVRCVYDSKVYWRVGQRNYIKSIIIQLVGASSFRKQAIKLGIPHNSSFAGIYQFTDASRYSQIFPRFLTQSKSGGIIMCHPGLQTSNSDDPIAAFRPHELTYFGSEQFVLDCFQQGVRIVNFKNIC